MLLDDCPWLLELIMAYTMGLGVNIWNARGILLFFSAIRASEKIKLKPITDGYTPRLPYLSKKVYHAK
jgi:hypothetical protein